MRPISKEKREISAAAKQRGEKEATIALWLGITVRPVAGIWKLYKTKGDVSPLKPKGRPHKLGKADFAKVAGEAGKAPDTTLKELIERLSLPIKKP